MMELTERQVRALDATVALPRIVNPRTNETFVLLSVDEYERLKGDAYDDSPWTAEERHALAWEAGRRAGWDDNGRIRRHPGEAMNRGDVVLDRFPHPSGLRGK